MTKKQSSVLYGIAILLMLYFHLFGAPGGLTNTEYISELNSVRGGVERLAWFGRICVAIYAFISGYGMYLSLRNIKGNGSPLGKRLGKAYAAIGKRILAFMRKYWIAFCVYVPLQLALGGVKIGGPFSFFKNFIALNCDYNGAWWYVKQYLFMLLLLPFIDLLFDFVFVKKCRTVRSFAVLAVQAVLYGASFYVLFYLCAVQPVKNSTYYILTFVAGYICSRFEMFSRLGKRIPAGTKFYVLGWPILAAVFAIRFALAKSYGHIGSDLILAPALCFGVCLITRKQGMITRFLAFLGKYSVYMWLIHGFFYSTYYLRRFLIIPRFSSLIYLLFVAVTLLTSGLLLFLEKQLCKLGEKIFQSRDMGSLAK